MLRRWSNSSGLLLLGILALALNLRAPLAALPPIVDEVASSLEITSTQAGILTGITMLCFGLVTPLASTVVGKWGVALSVTVSLAIIAVGSVLRSLAGYPTALLGTVLIGVAITLGNISLPVMAAREFRHRAATVTGLYVAMFNVGAALTSAATPLMASWWGWRWALGAWAVLAIAGLALWLPARQALHPMSTQHTHSPEVRATRIRRTWLLAFAFAGQAGGYITVTAWLPRILTDLGQVTPPQAGSAAAFFQLVAIVGGVLVPMALSRRIPLWAIALFMGLSWLALPLGLLLAPSAWLLWCCLAGMAQGGNFTVIFTVVATRAVSPVQARGMSTVVQTCGYSLAALGPPLLGAIHDSTHGWSIPLMVSAVVLGSMMLLTVAATMSQRERPPQR